MASLAHTGNPSLQYLMVRAELAQQSFQYTEFVIEMLTRLGQRVAALVGSTVHRMAAAHRQAVQDRMFWELALTDHRLMAELHAIQDYSESGQVG